MDDQVIYSSMALGTPLKKVENARRSEDEGSNIDIDEVHVSKSPKLSSDTEIEIEKDCMMINPFPKRIEKVPTFKIDKISLSVRGMDSQL